MLYVILHNIVSAITFRLMLSFVLKIYTYRYEIDGNKHQLFDNSQVSQFYQMYPCTTAEVTDQTKVSFEMEIR